MTTPEDFNTFLDDYEEKIKEYHQRKNEFTIGLLALMDNVIKDFLITIEKCETDEQREELAEKTFGTNAERALEILQKASAILKESHNDDAIAEIKTKLGELLQKDKFPDLRKLYNIESATPSNIPMAVPESGSQSVPEQNPSSGSQSVPQSKPKSRLSSLFNFFKQTSEPQNAVPIVNTGGQQHGERYTGYGGGRKKTKKHRKQKSHKKRTLHK
jgi:hypothetical protein